MIKKFLSKYDRYKKSYNKKNHQNVVEIRKIIEKYKIEPQYSIFIEDIARNLKPAYELGMKTVWIKNEEPWAAEFSDSNFINYKYESIRFLTILFTYFMF